MKFGFPIKKVQEESQHHKICPFRVQHSIVEAYILDTISFSYTINILSPVVLKYLLKLNNKLLNTWNLLWTYIF
jgi:hypothetical protein